MSAGASIEGAQLVAGILDGIRILDFSHQMSGPYCTAILGDMGADVLKIEAPGRGDGLRYEGDFDAKIGTPYIWTSNRNKRSVTLNIKEPKGRELALELARDPARLKAAREKLASGSPLFDTQRLARDMEAAFEAMLAAVK